MHVDLLAAVRLVERAQGDVGPDDARRDAAVGEGLVDGLEVEPRVLRGRRRGLRGQPPLRTDLEKREIGYVNRWSLHRTCEMLPE
jgi:hypothetical protein